MARPRQTIRTIGKKISLPEDLVAKLELHLYSEVDGKIPFAAQQEFFVKLLRDYFNTMEGGAK